MYIRLLYINIYIRPCILDHDLTMRVLCIAVESGGVLINRPAPNLSRHSLQRQSQTEEQPFAIENKRKSDKNA